MAAGWPGRGTSSNRCYGGRLYLLLGLSPRMGESPQDLLRSNGQRVNAYSNRIGDGIRNGGSRWHVGELADVLHVQCANPLAASEELLSPSCGIGNIGHLVVLTRWATVTRPSSPSSIPRPSRKASPMP